ncbi:MAG: hypothetical protein HZC37_10735 [Burkholderiales bacterium]|nr:hypothetical protein [Burkholderiales bacterium]
MLQRSPESPDTAAAAADGTVPHVQQLRQALLWPLRLMQAPGAGVTDDAQASRAPWQVLRDLGERSPWREQFDEYTGDTEGFHERHYNEFVAFLPYVQRFLYGHGRAQRGHDDAGAAGSPMRIFRRTDIAAARVVPRPGDAPVTLSVVHIDLYFFFGVEVVLLNVEVLSENLPLPLAQDLMYRFGRAYPPGWDARGEPLHCLAAFEWLDADGSVLAASDAQDQEAFLRHVAEHRAPRIARHWEFVLAPLVNHHSTAEGPLRYRQIEYHRMPMMAYLALDDPRRLSRHDFIRLGLVTGGSETLATALGPDGTGGPLPFAESHLADFERQFCYDRFWAEAGAAPHTRYLCSGPALVVVGTSGSEFFRCKDRGVLAQFRHQHFLLFLIAHLQKATLLMYSDRLAEALTSMDVTVPSSVKRFKRQIRLTYVAFLGFTHRYWFHEISEQAHVKALFHMCTRHLGIDALYAEVKDRVHDMNGYLDADSLRRQANTVVRLTVVTIFGLIGTVTTGFLGMNLLAEPDAPLATKLAYFFAVLVPTVVLTMYTMVKSKRLSDFLDIVSDERVPVWTKFKAFFAVWRSPDA